MTYILLSQCPCIYFFYFIGLIGCPNQVKIVKMYKLDLKRMLVKLTILLKMYLILCIYVVTELPIRQNLKFCRQLEVLLTELPISVFHWF